MYGPGDDLKNWGCVLALAGKLTDSAGAVRPQQIHEEHKGYHRITTEPRPGSEESVMFSLVLSGSATV